MAKLRRRKNRLTKAKLSASALSKTRKQLAAPAPKKESWPENKIQVEAAKFSPAAVTVAPPRMHLGLPSGYSKDKIVLQVRDPFWIHAYWELNAGMIEGVKAKLGEAFYSAKRVLRVYDVSQIIFNGTNAHRYFDREVGEEPNNWYIDTGAPGRSWCVDLGLRLANGQFITLLRSNVVQTPLDGPSWITDEDWMIPDDLFARLYGLGFGLGRSSPVGRAWQERIRKQIISSPGITSGASFVKKMQKRRKFWLSVNTELIVYGATEPDAKVLVQGKPIPLRPDGTFSLRFALPDGKQRIPVEGTSRDGTDKITVTPIVAKETR